MGEGSNAGTARRRGRACTRAAVAAAAALAAVAGLGGCTPREDRAAPAAAQEGVAAGADAVFTGLAGTQVRFASVAEARALLSMPDDWMRATGAVQRASLMEPPEPATLERFARWQGEHAIDWTPAQRERWRRALERIAPAFNRLGVPLPPTVLLIHTSGRESASTPHTRANAVVLPEGADLQGFGDEELLAHELFHVLSRAHPELASRIYALLGYERVGELRWPAAWSRLRVANPDAPHLDHAMPVRIDGSTRFVMPVVVAAREHADRARGETIEHLMDTRLLEVDPGRGGEATQAVLSGGAPRWHRLQDVPEFLQRLGGNTDYVLHPEETAADNFMLLVSRRSVPNPQLLQRLQQVLESARRDGAAAPAAATGSGASPGPG